MGQLKNKMIIFLYIYTTSILYAIIQNKYCRDSIRDDPKMALDSYVKRAQTISFVERGFEGLGLGHWSVGDHGVRTKVSHVRFVESFSSKRSGRLWFLAFFPNPLFWHINLHII